MRFLVPLPPKLSIQELKDRDDEDRIAHRHIGDLRGFPTAELGRYLEAAQRIAESEEKRKAGAEARATAYLAAIAALIPLMTWALGNTTPVCTSVWSCRAWSGAFSIAVGYFLFAAFWCLRTLAVANYVAFGVEDLVEIKDSGRPFERDLLVQTLQQARGNRNTINRKLDYVRTAQRCFFLGLLLTGGLLALDPWFRLVPASPGAAQTRESQQLGATGSAPKTAAPLTSEVMNSAPSEPATRRRGR